MTHFLDRLPYDFSDPAGRELWNLLVENYDSKQGVKLMLREIGLSTAGVNFEQPMRSVWADILRVARAKGSLRRLLQWVDESGDVGVAAAVRELVAVAPAAAAPAPGSILRPPLVSNRQEATSRLWIDHPSNLGDPTVERLVRIVNALDGTQTEIEGWFRRAGLPINEIGWPNPFKAIDFWPAAVIDLRRRGRLRNLVAVLASEFPTETTLEGFLTLERGGQAALYALADPLDSCFVGSGMAQPLIDRKDLRHQLRRLHTGGFRTLVVRGSLNTVTNQPNRGKTMSAALVQALLADDDHLLTIVDVSDWGTQPFDARELAVTLALQMTTMGEANIATQKIESVQAEDDHTRARRIGQELVYQIWPPSSGSVRWVMIDGLDRTNVTQDARTLVELLIKWIEQHDKPANVRFVVTGMDGISQPNTGLEVLTDLAVEDAREMLRTAAQQLGLDFDDATIADWLSQVVLPAEVLPGDVLDPEALEAIGKRIHSLVSAKLSGPGPNG